MKKLKVLFLCGLMTLCLPYYSLAGNAVKASPEKSNAKAAQGLYKGASIHPGKLVLKVKAEFRNACNQLGIQDQRMITAMQQIKSTELVRKFPRAESATVALNKHGKQVVDLSLIYEMNYSSAIPVEKAIATLLSSGMLEYAEPLFIHYQNFNPNDPNTGSQYFLTSISAYAAWDITKGDTNVVIGIVDSGTDWDHPDLQGNIKYNYADPIDGVDNDLDGFIDNFRGWDVSDNDNNPMNGNSNHGSHVSGCAAAVTDNGVGVAGPAFNCKFLPVKSSLNSSTTSIDNGYDGIIYAAEHGADIINCSWGRGGTPSQFEQDIINHVTLDLDRLVVAAAGNDGTESSHFPASYKYVTSVAWTGISDTKNSGSNFGYDIDVCAPGTNIYSTIIDDNYSSLSGTSMASPIAAGCAAMIKSKFPAMNALQIGEQLRVTCDNIYGVNTGYLYKLGKGRVNMFKAVTDSILPGVAVDQLVTRDRNDQVFVAGDTLDLVATLHNLLRPTANLACTLTTTSAYVSILSNTFNVGVLNTLDTISNFSLPFILRVDPLAPLNSIVDLRVTVRDGSWSDVYGFRITVNVDYINIAINDIGTSITSKGVIGYNDELRSQGLGFTYMGSNTLLYEMGLMIGATGTQVSDNVRKSGGSPDADLTADTAVLGQEPGLISDFDAHGTFTDYSSPAPLNLFITHRAFAWTSAADRKYVMVDYLIKNTGTNTLNALYAGLCADWDIDSFANNKASVDNARRMGYVWSTDGGGLYAAIKLLSHTGGFTHYAIDNEAGGGGLNLSDGTFSDSEKYEAISTSRTDAGAVRPTGNDVIDVVSSGPFTLSPGSSASVAFALIGGENLTMLQESADAAQFKYDSLFVGIETISLATGYALEQNYPNPASGISRIQFTIKETAHTNLTLYDAQGKKMKVLVDEKLNGGTYSAVFDLNDLPAGIYHYSLNSGDFRKTLSLTVVR